MKARHLDHAGSATQIACAVHCALSPLILPVLPLAGAGWFGSAPEWSFLGLSFLLGVVSLGHSYRVVHRDARAMANRILGTRWVRTLGPDRPLFLECERASGGALVVASGQRRRS